MIDGPSNLSSYGFSSIQGPEVLSRGRKGAGRLHEPTESVGGCSSGHRQGVGKREKAKPVQIVDPQRWQEYPSTGYGYVRCKATSTEAAGRAAYYDSVQSGETRVGAILTIRV